jgi:hypothetical protein
MTRRTMTNKRPGTCHRCGALVEPGEGLAVLVPTGRTRGQGRWHVEHRPVESSWKGSPVSGTWITSGGCPARTGDA